MQDHNVKQLGRISVYAKCIGGCMQGARYCGFESQVTVCLKKKEFFKEFITSLCFFCLGHQGKQA